MTDNSSRLKLIKVLVLKLALVPSWKPKLFLFFCNVTQRGQSGRILTSFLNSNTLFPRQKSTFSTPIDFQVY